MIIYPEELLKDNINVFDDGSTPNNDYYKNESHTVDINEKLQIHNNQVESPEIYSTSRNLLRQSIIGQHIIKRFPNPNISNLDSREGIW